MVDGRKERWDRTAADRARLKELREREDRLRIQAIEKQQWESHLRAAEERVRRLEQELGQ
jgi:hypothetical protein